MPADMLRAIRLLLPLLRHFACAYADAAAASALRRFIDADADIFCHDYAVIFAMPR